MGLAIAAFVKRGHRGRGGTGERCRPGGSGDVASRAARAFGTVEEIGENRFVETEPPIGETPVETAAALSDLGVGKTRIVIEALAGKAEIGDEMAVSAPVFPVSGFEPASLSRITSWQPRLPDAAMRC